MARSEMEWLKHLIKCHDKELKELRRLDEYYEGEQPLSYMAPELIQELDERVRQVVIESDHGYVLIVPTDHGTCVAAYGSGEVRLDLLAHRVHSQVARLGEKAMATAPRGSDDGAPA